MTGVQGVVGRFSLYAVVLPCLMWVSAFADGQPAADAETAAPPATLGELLDRVRGAAERDRALAAAREERFLLARQEQAVRVAEVRRARESADREADRLRQAYEAGEAELSALETALAGESGDLSELFAIARQTASDAGGMLTQSMVGAEYPARSARLDALIDSRQIPGLDELRGLWLMLLEEMEGGGRVARLSAPVISAAGEEQRQEITRIGPFTAIADGRYLRYLPETGRFLAIDAAAAGSTPAALRAFEAAREPVLPISIDPSRGSILSLLVQAPDFGERIRQGGIIGIAIIVLGVIGLLVALERIIVLFLNRRRLERALRGEGSYAQLDALRRLSPAAATGSSEALAASVEEILNAAGRRLRRGIQLLSIFAAVAPLLGLLGTVTGMIETFQVITLFGAGDPRLMSGGISQALVTTQLGLCVAIPLLLLHGFIRGQVNHVLGALEDAGAGVLMADTDAVGKGGASATAR